MDFIHRLGGIASASFRRSVGEHLHWLISRGARVISSDEQGIALEGTPWGEVFVFWENPDNP
jgi:hypothetical protein